MAIRNRVLQSLYFHSSCFLGKPEEKETTWKTQALMGEEY
jgi:hypothetical protein